ncbi:MAG: hypothetical protein Q8O67_04970 [Deltaproteobacteria bacterium]|nr:hypothetical protein [Deltaproteobacteria bacterium]
MPPREPAVDAGPDEWAEYNKQKNEQKRAERERACDAVADAAVLDVTRRDAQKHLDAGDGTGAVVVVDAAGPHLGCPSSAASLNELRRQVFLSLQVRSEGPCETYGVGWRARADFVTVLDGVAGVDAQTRDELREIASARVSTVWPTPGIDSALLAAKIERTLREQLRVDVGPSRFTIEHVVDSCIQSTGYNSLLDGTMMKSFGCTGMATVARDGDVWARIPVRYQLLGISLPQAISSYSAAGSGGGGAAALANEIRLRVLDDAERRLCSSR